MTSTNTEQSFLDALPTELLSEASHLDHTDFLRLRATFNRAVIAKTENHYANILAKEVRNVVWFSPYTLRMLEAVGCNPRIAPRIHHIDFNVLYLDIVNN
jgi:hypothetical protein